MTEIVAEKILELAEAGETNSEASDPVPDPRAGTATGGQDVTRQVAKCDLADAGLLLPVRQSCDDPKFCSEGIADRVVGPHFYNRRNHSEKRDEVPRRRVSPGPGAALVRVRSLTLDGTQALPTR
jgi:hypothetical protein